MAFAFLAAVVVRSLAEFLASDPAEVPFEFTGTIAGIAAPSDIAFTDGTNSAFIYRGTATLPSGGDRVTIRGHVRTNEKKYRMLCADTISVLGHGPAASPLPATLPEVTSGRLDYRVVRVKGRITDVHNDEISSVYKMLVMASSDEMAVIPFDSRNSTDGLLNAEVAVTGIVRPIYKGDRIFSTYLINPLADTPLEILTKPPADAFSVLPLGDLHHVNPKQIAELGYRKATGRVLAAWDRNHVLVDASKAGLPPLHVILRHDRPLPRTGETVEVVGFVETDLFSVLLTDSDWRPKARSQSSPAAEEPAVTRLISDLAPSEPDGILRVGKIPTGRLVEVQGTVQRIDPENQILVLEANGKTVKVNFSSCPQAASGFQLGSLVLARGICILMAERWRPIPRYPKVNGIIVIARNADDFTTLSSQPWWTPKKLTIVIAALGFVIVAIIIWNRVLDRLVDRRSRALLKERLAHDAAELKKEERTKLAVELHDSLSQNLTGIAFQLDVAELTAESSPEDVLPHLRQIRLKMKNCRDNLKNCLWDLRNLAIDQTFLADSLRETLSPVIGQTAVSIDFPVRNSTLDDSLVHAIICIVRELAVNAVRHGKATRIDVVGRQDADGIGMTVRDNGDGFDPERREGTSGGHFGLQGISERVSRFNGEMDIVSHPGKGTEVSIRGLHDEN